MKRNLTNFSRMVTMAKIFEGLFTSIENGTVAMSLAAVVLLAGLDGHSRHRQLNTAIRNKKNRSQ